MGLGLEVGMFPPFMPTVLSRDESRGTIIPIKDCYYKGASKREEGFRMSGTAGQGFGGLQRLYLGCARAA